ncbi:MAG TPA: hypothetical protein VH814_09680 [Steroidobacteraceae bacterium]|jgi:hypothetical protein
MSLKPAQPQSIGGVLDTTFQLYKASVVKMIPLTLLSLLAASPVYIYYIYVFIKVGGSANPAAAMASFGPGLGYWLSMGLTFVLSQLMLAASAIRMNEIGAGSDAGIGTALRTALPRLPSLAIAALLYTIAFAVGFLLLIIPGVIFSVSLLLFVGTCVFDNKGPVGSLTASHRLVWGNWWRTSAILVVGFILLLVLYMVMILLISIVSPLAATAVGPGNVLVFTLIIGVVVGALMGLVMTPFYIALMLALYWDLKLRKEGADLAGRVGALNPA